MEILLKKSKRFELLKAITTSPRTRLIRSIRKKWKSLDMYGKQVQFTYKGKKTYQTSIGAFFSIITNLIMGALAAYELYLVFAVKEPYIYEKSFL